MASAAVAPDRPLVAVLDYGIGNLRSAQKALERVGADARLTDDAGLVAEAAGVVLPGVGAFGPCMQALRQAGLDRVALNAIVADVPFLGICVGMQLLYQGSDESPGVEGLGVLPGTVRRLPDGVKRPQMQWNVLDWTRRSALADGQPDPAWVYFVHSYAAEPADAEAVLATTEHDAQLTAVVGAPGIVGSQFHPEKSGAVGASFLRSFVAAVS